MQKCITCGVLIPLTEFYKSKKLKDGYRNECIDCWKKNSKKWYRNNSKRAKEVNKKWQKENPEWQKNQRKEIKNKYGLGAGTIARYGFKLAVKIYDKYDRKCVECGEENDLTLHHLDGKGRNYENKGLKPNNSEDNLILICRRCHGSIHGKDSWKNRKKKGA